MSDKETRKEIRELDRWIGINLFDLHEFEPTPTNTDICAYCSHHISFSEHFKKEWIGVSNTLPHYTTDPAASMMVLKKCAQKMSPDGGESAPVIEWLGDVEESWRVVESDHFDGIESEASSLELAICLFAKQLFHAKEKETKVH